MPGWLKLLLALVVATGAGGGYLYIFDPQLGRQLLSGTPLQLPASVVTAYKWRDAKGNWQLTAEPPPEGTACELLETRSDDNIVPALPLKN